MESAPKCKDPVAVCSRTFSKHPVLREKMLERFARVQFNEPGEKLAGARLAEFLRGCRGAIIALEPLTREVLAELPDLKAVAKYGVGLDGIDQQALADHGVQLGWTGGVNRRSVSELTLGLILASLRQIAVHSMAIKQGEWKNRHGQQLSEKTVGVIGCGFIGSDLLRLLQPFQCQILVNDLLDKKDLCAEFGARPASKEEIYTQSDVVSLHVPLTDQTRALMGAREFEKMKDSATLINTSRGSVVDEAALYQALKNGQIAAAALDVFAEEPPRSPLFELDNFIATPHNGGSSHEGVLAMGQAAIDNLYRSLV